MTTVSLKFRPSSVPGREGSLFFHIRKNGKLKRVSTRLSILESEWDSKNSRLKFPYRKSSHEKIFMLQEETEWQLNLLRYFVDSEGPENQQSSFNLIVKRFKENLKHSNFFAFMHSVILELFSFGKEGTLKNYRAAFNSLKLFCGKPVLPLNEITPEFIGNYQKFLSDKGIVPNTVSFYMRIFRAVYNRAINEGLVGEAKPFNRACTGIYPTTKRALSQSSLKKIRQIDLSCHPSLEYARDIFLLSFFLRGMSFIDMAYLKKSDLKNNYIGYWRRKTGKPLRIKWTREMEQIRKKYSCGSSEFFLPIFVGGDSDRRSFNRIYAYINRNLKKLGRILKLPIPLTMYVARHSWASFAKSLGIPVNIISDGLGHDSEATTKIYLKSLESNLVDAANSKIISSI